MNQLNFKHSIQTQRPIGYRVYKRIAEDKKRKNPGFSDKTLKSILFKREFLIRGCNS